MSYRLPGRDHPLGQALTQAQLRAALPRTGIAGSGITWEMVGIGAVVVGLLGAMVVASRARQAVWEAAIPDEDERKGWQTALAARSFVGALRR